MLDSDFGKGKAHDRCPRTAAIADIEHLLAAAQALRASVRSTEVQYRRTLRLLEKGAEISDALEDVQAGATRLTLTQTLDTFEMMRHRSRLALVAAGLAEGMTIGELGRTWRFSRQLASRYAKEARARFGPPPRAPRSGSPRSTPRGGCRPAIRSDGPGSPRGRRAARRTGPAG
jgi:hypothetical protein